MKDKVAALVEAIKALPKEDTQGALIALVDAEGEFGNTIKGNSRKIIERICLAMIECPGFGECVHAASKAMKAYAGNTPDTIVVR
jgi:hypothetical protein